MTGVQINNLLIIQNDNNKLEISIITAGDPPLKQGRKVKCQKIRKAILQEKCTYFISEKLYSIVVTLFSLIKE